MRSIVNTKFKFPTLTASSTQVICSRWRIGWKAIRENAIHQQISYAAIRRNQMRHSRFKGKCFIVSGLDYKSSWRFLQWAERIIIHIIKLTSGKHPHLVSRTSISHGGSPPCQSPAGDIARRGRAWTPRQTASTALSRGVSAPAPFNHRLLTSGRQEEMSGTGELSAEKSHEKWPASRIILTWKVKRKGPLCWWAEIMGAKGEIC